MKRIVITILLSIITLASYSQIDAKRLASRLQLTDKQYEYIYTITQNLNKDMANTRQEENTHKRVIKYMDAVKKNLKQTKKVLTKEQQRLYTRMLLETIKNDIINELK